MLQIGAETFKCSKASLQNISDSSTLTRTQPNPGKRIQLYLRKERRTY
jgi:hypothetical protein